MDVKLESSWYDALKEEFEQAYFLHLREYLHNAYRSRVVFPRGSYIFRALDRCPKHRVKVVILGQDPYHGVGEAEGLAFSVPDGVRIPPSLVNIKTEIIADMGMPSIISGGHLMPWVEQGVLLLNSVLTVEQDRAGSHQGIGWEQFTDRVIEVLAQEDRPLVFMLWGGYARRKGALIDRKRHLVLEAPHPSPLSASRGFFGCRHFSQANRFLAEHNIEPIRW